ncbi:MAG: hypothetical protein VKO64_01140 [Candidatus Sericytochromatia bacterium]|nr:hypothetical protein [Candidatus Sericytochromatia bacterium]
MSSIFGPRNSGSTPPIQPIGGAPAPSSQPARGTESQPSASSAPGDVNGTAELNGRSSGIALPEPEASAGPDIEDLGEGALRSTADLRQFLEAARDNGVEGVTAEDDGSLSASGPALEMMGLWTGTVADDRSLASLGIVNIRLSA